MRKICIKEINSTCWLRVADRSLKAKTKNMFCPRIYLPVEVSDRYDHECDKTVSIVNIKQLWIFRAVSGRIQNTIAELPPNFRLNTPRQDPVFFFQTAPIFDLKLFVYGASK
jgi:hypothetical protein